jgi:hypothetical protein
MKVKLIPAIVAVLLSALIAYGFYSFHKFDNQILLSVGGFVFCAVTLFFTFGVNSDLSRTTTNIRFLSITFFLIALISNLIFCFTNFSVPLYVILNGILLLIYILIVYSITKTKM